MKSIILAAFLSLSLTACGGILSGGSSEPGVQLSHPDGNIEGILATGCHFDLAPQPITTDQYATFPQGSSFNFTNEGERAADIVFFAWSVLNGLPDTQILLQFTVPARSQFWTPELGPGNYILEVVLEYENPTRCYNFWFPVEITDS